MPLSAAVGRLREALAKLGYGPITSDGLMGSATRSALERFERDKNLPVTGDLGPKTAKLIVVQLAGKLKALPRAAVTVGSASAAPNLARQVVEALIALGWSERVATEVVDDVTAASDAATVPALLKLALAQLGPARSPKATKEQSSV